MKIIIKKIIIFEQSFILKVYLYPYPKDKIKKKERERKGI